MSPGEPDLHGSPGGPPSPGTPDEAHANADQEASDADQEASDADQAASDADQAAADGNAPEETWPEGVSEKVREYTAGQRESTAKSRAETNRLRSERLANQPRTGPSIADAGVLELIHTALNQQRFILFAQPIVEIETGNTIRHELLIRMLDGEGELMSPGEFIPIAERFSFSVEIDRWVVSQAAELTKAGHPVQINIAGSSLGEPDFGEFVERELNVAGDNAALTVFEITETALIGNEALAARFFKRAHSLGCQIAIDDFGSGYGGFRYLKNFAVDYLKVDQEFITDIAVHRGSRKVVSAIVGLAEEFDLRVIAEGVEAEETVAQIRSLEIEFGQGYFFGRPAPAAEALAEHPAVPMVRP